ncbi:choline-sulfatase [Wenxinia marina]|uniref:Choline-sulfatase n=1 Tax=Wenxinia marina DSM 24838 TaxID=1123501 RepID=A0A0D0Q2G0_9RHOB|nr:choline-sulfatase [Wenxinia marina]KIQ68689.1 choline-sulfatase [Wenxinia marina DSM 24838]GGL67935.1 choline-sulfatase [Wenxinia marina]
MSQPNILILMVDQLNGTLFPDGPADWLHVPNLRRLAERSARFAHAYTPSPLCAPARAAVMAGQMPFRTRVYDNAAEFQSSIPTFAHHLRNVGYHTVLSGKMHFVGPDQLHGFEERLTTDVYPADFGWTPDWRKPGERIDWWYHNFGSVTGAGVAEITNQMEYDDEVAYNAMAKLYDLSRGHDGRPWCLTVSFTHPHDPFVARRRFWDLYEDGPLDPELKPVPYAELDPHSQRLMDASDRRNFDITLEDVRRSRRAYFANISYIDDKIGQILDVLESSRQEAAIVFLSDHGEMLGEGGQWFKMSFREGSSRVPFMLCADGVAPGRVETPVSTVDLTPTLADLAGADLGGVAPWTDGVSLLPVAAGGERKPVAVEYAAEGSIAPMVCLIEGRWKYTACPADPEQLFDLDSDPWEQTNLAGEPGYEGRLKHFRDMAAERWDLERVDAEVRHSQAGRWVVYPALRQGGYYPWDWQPIQRASDRYMRNHMDLNVLEENQRFPRGE